MKIKVEESPNSQFIYYNLLQYIYIILDNCVYLS